MQDLSRGGAEFDALEKMWVLVNLRAKRAISYLPSEKNSEGTGPDFWSGTLPIIHFVHTIVILIIVVIVML